MTEAKFTGEAVRKLFVGSLDRSMTDEQLKEYFDKFGDVSGCEVIKDSENMSKGYAFVTYASIDSADSCVSSRPHNIGLKEATVKHNVPRNDDSATAALNTNKIFIGGVHNNTEEEIREFFENPAFKIKIKSVEVKKHPQTNENLGFGFMTLETSDMADKVHIVRRIEEKNWDVLKAKPEGGDGGGSVGGMRCGGVRGMGRRRGGYARGGRGGYGGGY